MATRVIQYRAVLSWWVAILVVLYCLFMTAAMVLALWQPISLGQKVVVGLASSAAILYMLDCTFYMRYSLTKNGLLISSVLRHVHIPYRSMVAIKPIGIRGLSTGLGLRRFALSHKAIVVTLDRFHWKMVSLSPEKQDLFINELLHMIEGERSSRSSVDRAPSKRT